MKKGSEAKGKVPATAARAAEAPRAPAGSPPPARSGGIDLTTVRELARIATEMNLSEVEAAPSGRIRVRRRVARRALEGRPSHAAHRPPIQLAPPPPVEGAPEPGTFITSPFVGTFYRAPSPEASAFVEIGDT